MHSIQRDQSPVLGICPKILKTTASQVDHYEFPCSGFASLIKNGPQYIPNGWSLVEETEKSCFLAHVVKNPSSYVPNCDRVIYLKLDFETTDGLTLDCEELHVKPCKTVIRKVYSTTVEYLGDLLALLTESPEDESDEDYEGSKLWENREERTRPGRVETPAINHSYTALVSDHNYLQNKIEKTVDLEKVDYTEKGSKGKTSLMQLDTFAANELESSTKNQNIGILTTEPGKDLEREMLLESLRIKSEPNDVFHTPVDEDFGIISSRLLRLESQVDKSLDMQPFVKLEPMEGINDYIANKAFRLKLVEEETSASLNGSDLVNYASGKKTGNAYAHKKLPPDINDKFLSLERNENGKYTCFLCPFQNNYHCRIKKHLFSHIEKPPQPKVFYTINKALNGTKGPLICSVCNKEFSSPTNLNRHIATHSPDKPHQCLKCGRRFAQNQHVKNHLKNVHETSNKVVYTCTECPFMFGKKAGLTAHLRDNHGIKRENKCQECGKIFKHAGNLSSHIKIIHRGEKPSCNLCGRKFYNKFSLNSHMVTHQKSFFETFHHTAQKNESTGRWMCNQCGKDFKLKASLKIHTMTHLNIKHKCSICDKSYTTASSLKCHQDVHSGIKRFNCKYCKKAFRQRSSCKAHENIHENKLPYKCQYCGKGFNQLTNKNRHESLHLKKVMELDIDPLTGEMSYKENYQIVQELPKQPRKKSATGPRKGTVPNCKICGKTFKLLNQRRQHMLSHAGEKPFKCPKCQAGFKLHSNLNRHLKNHRDDRPFRCQTCGRCFNQLSKLEKHKRVHVSKPKESRKNVTTCEMCHKEFSSNVALRGHMSKHTRGKPFACPVCQKRFVNLQTLRNHLLTCRSYSSKSSCKAPSPDDAIDFNNEIKLDGNSTQIVVNEAFETKERAESNNSIPHEISSITESDIDDNSFGAEVELRLKIISTTSLRGSPESEVKSGE